MFVRIKTTPNSPRKSVQLVESVRRKGKVTQKIVRHVGIAYDDKELDQMKKLAEHIKYKLEDERNPTLFSPETIEDISKYKKENKDEKLMVNLRNLEEEQRFIQGIHEVYGKVYEDIKFDTVIGNTQRNVSVVEILRHMVLARIANPDSKRGSATALERDFGVEINLDKVYRMMDKIDDTVVQKIKDTSYKHAQTLFAEKIDVLFFDTTTLYFESFAEDEFKRNGYSKDGKFNQPQVLFALLVTKAGIPIGYEAFPGNQYEGHTLIPILTKLKEQYQLDKIVFVADSGLFNKDNIEALEANNFEYIVGVRLRNMKDEIKQQILQKDNYKKVTYDNVKLSIKDDEYSMAEFEYNNKQKLIVTHSVKRAKKDKHDRDVSVEKLIKKAKTSKDIQSLISNYGYKKYIQVDTKEEIKINEKKILEESQWDGLHGMITNAKDLSNTEVIEHYKGLWQVEESFRINKHDLRIRPIFHWTPKRIKAHIAIAFMAFCCVRSLEYRLTLQYTKLSPEVIRRELLHVQGSILKDKQTLKKYFMPSKLGVYAEKIYKLIGLSTNRTPYLITK